MSNAPHFDIDVPSFWARISSVRFRSTSLIEARSSLVSR